MKQLNFTIPFGTYFASAIVFLIIGCYILGIDNLNIVSISSLALSFCWLSLIVASFSVSRSDKEPNSHFSHSVFLAIFLPFHSIQEIENERNRSVTVFLILLGTLLAGLLGSYLAIKNISTSEKTLSLVSGISAFSLIMTQVGGWFFQSCLIYMFSYILGATKPFNTYLALVGVSYVGFFLISVINIFINLSYIPSGLTPQEFQEVMTGSYLHGILGKAGEFWVLTLISAGVFVIEKEFSLIKSVLVVITPSLLLVAAKLFFSTIL